MSPSQLAPAFVTASVPVALVLDPDTGFLRTVEDELRRAGWTVLTAADAAEAVRFADALGRDLTVFLVGDAFGGDSLGALVKRLQQRCPRFGVVYFCGFGATAPIDAVVVERPVRPGEVRAAARSAIPAGVRFSLLEPDGD